MRLVVVRWQQGRKGGAPEELAAALGLIDGVLRGQRRRGGQRQQRREHPHGGRVLTDRRDPGRVRPAKI